MHQGKKRIDAIDKQIGERIRKLRTDQGLSQSDLAALAGVTYQQIHKYERGINRLSAGRAAVIAEVLGVSVEALYASPDSTLPTPDREEEWLSMKVARSFRHIQNPRHREALYTFIRALGQE